MAVRISKDDFEEKVIKADKPVLVDFYSDTCIPCKKMSGVVAQIEEEYAGKAYVYKVNSLYEADLVEQYGVMSAPTFIIFKDGEEVQRLRGVQTKDALVEKLQ